MLLSTFHYQPCFPTVRQPPVRPWNATQRRFSSAKLLHWNGPRKPFPTGKPGGKRQHAELFEPYRGKGEKCEV